MRVVIDTIIEDSKNSSFFMKTDKATRSVTPHFTAKYGAANCDIQEMLPAITSVERLHGFRKTIVKS